MAVDARGRLSLAFKDLETVPSVIAQRHGQSVVELDLSHNQLTTLTSLAPFQNVETLILDHNELTSHAKLPALPRLKTLWVNHNKIRNLSVFVDHLAIVVPSLKHLSMLYNEACPNFFNGGTAMQYADYRLFVISRLKELKMLDDQAVTPEEKKESLIAYAAYKMSIVVEQGAALNSPIPRVMIRPKGSKASPPPSIRSVAMNGGDSISATASPAGKQRSPSIAQALAPEPFQWDNALDARQLAQEQQQRLAANESPDSDWSSDEDIPSYVYSGRSSQQTPTTVSTSS